MIDRFQAFVMGISNCYKFIQRIKSMEMKEFGLKGTHVMCLFYLYHNENGLTAAQLCQLCAEDKAAISRTLATLQKEGYVLAEEKKYRSIICLSETGKAVAMQVDQLIEQWVATGGDGLEEAQRTCFYQSLETISDNLRETLEDV